MDKSIIVGTGVILMDDSGRVLLVKDAKEKRGGGKDKWGIIGGMQEGHLNFEENAIKEALEETGYKVRIEKLVGIYQSVEENYNRISVIFLAFPIENTMSFAKDEITEIRWFDYRDIPWEDLRFGHNKRMIQDAFENSYSLDFLKYL